ncbi:MAG TPA: cytochrome P450 [Nevskiaceae bacterium]|nr:cytochrome P450 [Nevskiaceae bacterium]
MAAAIPRVPGLPIFGSLLSILSEPVRFFVSCYRKYGPICEMRVLGQRFLLLGGVEAANLLGSRVGKDCLRSRQFWEGLIREYGATRALVTEDGESHKELRDIMRRGYSRESIKGRYDECVRNLDEIYARDFRPGARVPVVQAMQYMAVGFLGPLLTDKAPVEYVRDIRIAILYILNVLITRQRPKFFLLSPEYRRAKARVVELGHRMIAEAQARAGRIPDEKMNLVDDIIAAQNAKPGMLTTNDLVVAVTGPYVAGLDTVANTTAVTIYMVLKHPEVRARIEREVDALFDAGPIVEEELLQRLPALNGAIMESMRLYPIAIAQIRTVVQDFEFQGHAIRAGDMLYVSSVVPHFMDEYYPDAERFDIDRYEKPRAEHMQPGAWSPYGRGPHTCLGKTLAEVQLALSMARLFYKYDLELDPPDYRLKTKVAPTPGPAMSFRVRVRGLRH